MVYIELYNKLLGFQHVCGALVILIVGLLVLSIAQAQPSFQLFEARVLPRSMPPAVNGGTNINTFPLFLPKYLLGWGNTPLMCSLDLDLGRTQPFPPLF